MSTEREALIALVDAYTDAFHAAMRTDGGLGMADGLVAKAKKEALRDALDAALAQPLSAQPVAWINADGLQRLKKGWAAPVGATQSGSCGGNHKLYLHPPADARQQLFAEYLQDPALRAELKEVALEADALIANARGSEALRVAAQKLVNEVFGVVEMARDRIGHTNAQCLIKRANDVSAALAASQAAPAQEKTS